MHMNEINPATIETNFLNDLTKPVEVPTMKKLIQYISQSLVDRPDEVDVIEITGEQTSVYELRVAKEDLGKVIGKQGKMAQSIRHILSASSAKMNKRAVLEIIE